MLDDHRYQSKFSHEELSCLYQSSICALLWDEKTQIKQTYFDLPATSLVCYEKLTTHLPKFPTPFKGIAKGTRIKGKNCQFQGKRSSPSFPLQSNPE